ncbi:RagB/SusD family nutrient uptake outer membrane protein [Bacteroides fragilis]|nr:RagB/SusD family nutrient uptake outer membrane protein [Bacteroides fragilis]
MRLNNLPLLRLSEVYLSAAEAAAKLGGHQG